MKSGDHGQEPPIQWFLVYTKARAERWAEANLRRQGYATVLPYVRAVGGESPLFPRYVFVGCHPGQRAEPLRSTSGVLYTVTFGSAPAAVHPQVIDDIRARMDPSGFVTVESGTPSNALFAARERERTRTLRRLAEAGFRVKVA